MSIFILRVGCMDVMCLTHPHAERIVSIFHFCKNVRTSQRIFGNLRVSTNFNTCASKVWGRELGNGFWWNLIPAQCKSEHSFGRGAREAVSPFINISYGVLLISETGAVKADNMSGDSTQFSNLNRCQS